MAWTSATPWLTKETQADGGVKLSKLKTRAIPALARPSQAKQRSDAACCECCLRRHGVSCVHLHEVLVLELGVVSPQRQHARLHGDCLRKPTPRRSHTQARTTQSVQRSPCTAYRRQHRPARTQARCDGIQRALGSPRLRASAAVRRDVSGALRTKRQSRSDSPQRWVPMALSVT